MPAIHYGNRQYIFGIPDPLPAVPPGWTLQPAADEFLRVLDPRGLPYFITTTGIACLIVSELSDFVALERVEPPEWIVEPKGEESHILRFKGREVEVWDGENGLKILSAAADLFNRKAITFEEFQVIDSLSIDF